ncbi:MAG: hypoxanthine phosphoribosyltransferase [Bacteroidota bacterium]
MSKVALGDKVFEVSIPHDTLQSRIREVARQITADLSGKQPLFLPILNGAFMFASDLLKHIELDCTVSFMRLASYEGTTTTGKVKTLLGPKKEIRGASVVIIEDIVDTGITLEHIMEQLEPLAPAEVRIATLLFKPGAYQKNRKIDYAGFEVPNDFLVGYGLDYDGLGRNLKHIYVLSEAP